MQDPGHRRHQVPVRHHLGPADLVGPADRLRPAQHAGEVDDHVVERDRLAARLHPARRDHHRQTLDQLSQHLPADAAVADDDPGSQCGGRRLSHQDRLDLAPAAEVIGEVVALVAEPAEVHDLADAGLGGCRRQRFGRRRDPWRRSRYRRANARGSTRLRGRAVRAAAHRRPARRRRPGCRRRGTARDVG